MLGICLPKRTTDASLRLSACICDLVCSPVLAKSRTLVLWFPLVIHWKDWCWSWNSNTLATWCEELTHWESPWCRERWKAGGKGVDKEWDGWMVSLTQWTWVWINSGSWWWTGRPGMLQSMGSQRVGHDWTELTIHETFICQLFK